jgi:hypothetical protein
MVTIAFRIRARGVTDTPFDAEKAARLPGGMSIPGNV